MKTQTLAGLLLLPAFAHAGGFLGDVTSDLGRVSKSLDSPNALIVDQAVRKIERAEIAQSIQVDALVKRVVELENVVKKQQDIINQYQKVVSELQVKVGSAK